MASSTTAISGPTTKPAACMPNTRLTSRPRLRLPEYSLMIVALTG